MDVKDALSRLSFCSEGLFEIDVLFEIDGLFEIDVLENWRVHTRIFWKRRYLQLECLEFPALALDTPNVAAKRISHSCANERLNQRK